MLAADPARHNPEGPVDPAPALSWAAVTIVAFALAACAPDRTEEAAAVLRAYASKTADPGRSFHLSQRGTVSVMGRTFLLHHELDVSGNNLRGTHNIDAAPAEIIVLDGRAFTKSGGEWGGGHQSDLADDILDVFRYAGDGADLRFVEPLEEAGETVFHYRTIKPVPYQNAEIRRLGQPGSIDELELFVRPDGVPVRILFRSNQGEPRRAVVTQATVDFSRWGEPISIEAPT
jgi:hypothetical protein